MRGDAHSAERGASGIEYVGMIVVAAIVVAAIVLAISPAGADVRAATCRAVGQVLQTELGCAAGGGSGDDAAPPEDEDYEPGPCTVTQSGNQVSSVVSVGIVDFGENAGLERQTMSDGTVTLTATDGGSLGLSSGAGAEVRTGGGVELGASIDFGGGYTFAGRPCRQHPPGVVRRAARPHRRARARGRCRGGTRPSPHRTRSGEPAAMTMRGGWSPSAYPWAPCPPPLCHPRSCAPPWRTWRR